MIEVVDMPCTSRCCRDPVYFVVMNWIICFVCSLVSYFSVLIIIFCCRCSARGENSDVLDLERLKWLIERWAQSMVFVLVFFLRCDLGIRSFVLVMPRLTMDCKSNPANVILPGLVEGEVEEADKLGRIHVIGFQCRIPRFYHLDLGLLGSCTR
ncbi:hypothetical protein Ddye_006048 [Dipteronia dyeriana]|uniref:Uncharacterized protein n=1 Tax=Dipteronia dyeriana TaxID=168575 RepID=A0AAE0CQ69_9ROSI|nr:hypothetical protein Ddye_006048 [Dipteronia dyeriana]